MTPVIITCLNNRPKISPIIFECAKRLGLPVIAGVTEQCDYDLAESYGAYPVRFPNKPVGAKWNAVLKAAYEHVNNFSHFLIMGDDDSIGDHGFTRLKDWIESVGGYGYCDYVGFKSNGYYDLKTGQAIKHTYPHKCDKLIGAGRMISRLAIEKTCYKVEVEFVRDYLHLNIKKGQRMMVNEDQAKYLTGYYVAKIITPLQFIGLWPPQLNSALDEASELVLVLNGFVPVAVDDDRIHVTDFKSRIHTQNIHTYSILETKPNCKNIAPDEATWFLSDAEKELIESLR